MRIFIFIFLIFLSSTVFAQEGRYIGFQAGFTQIYSDVYSEDVNRHYTPHTNEYGGMGTFTYGYQFKNRLAIEAGYRWWVAGTTVDGRKAIGVISKVHFPVRVIPVLLRYRIPLLNDRLFLVPEAGVSFLHAFWSKHDYYSWMALNGIKMETWIRKAGRNHKFGYEAGLGLDYKIKSFYIGLSCKYHNTFNRNMVLRQEILFTIRGSEQPLVYSQSKLAATFFTLSVRKLLRNKSNSKKS